MIGLRLYAAASAAVACGTPAYAASDNLTTARIGGTYLRNGVEACAERHRRSGFLSTSVPIKFKNLSVKEGRSDISTMVMCYASDVVGYNRRTPELSNTPNHST